MHKQLGRTVFHGIVLALGLHGLAMAGGAGFEPTGIAADSDTNTVVIAAAPNCTREQSQRARALESALKSRGIPVKISAGGMFRFTNPALMDHVVEQMTSSNGPPVFLHGKMKLNPTADEVAAEYTGKKPLPPGVVEEVTFK